MMMNLMMMMMMMTTEKPEEVKPKSDSQTQAGGVMMMTLMTLKGEPYARKASEAKSLSANCAKCARTWFHELRFQRAVEQNIPPPLHKCFTTFALALVIP